MFASLIIALAAGATQVTDLPPADMDPRRMSQSQIRAHNANLSRNDPDYIRCVASEDTGSLVRKRVSCRTNAQWRHDDDVGNQNARDTMEYTQSKASATSN